MPQVARNYDKYFIICTYIQALRSNRNYMACRGASSMANTVRKRKVKARNYISSALVSFSCVYVRFASPKTHPSQRINFGPCCLAALAVAAAAVCTWVSKCVSARGLLFKRAYKPIYKHLHNGLAEKKLQNRSHSYISLTSLHTIVLYALHSQWSANVCMLADLSTPYLDEEKRNVGTRSEKKWVPKGMCNSFSFRRLVRSNFFSLFLSFSVSLHFYRIHSKLNACCGGNRFQRRRSKNTHIHIHTYQDGQAKRIR